MRYRPWKPVQVVADNVTPVTDLEMTKTHARCLQLLSEGNAGADEQKIALDAIFHMCGVDDTEYLPDEHGGARDGAFKSGKRHIGLQLRKIVRLPLNLLTGET